MNEQEEQKEIKKEEPKQQQPIKNKTNMYCPNCKEIIAKTGVSDLVKETHDFEGLEALQKIESWWIFKDMFHFENIDFCVVQVVKKRLLDFVLKVKRNFI
eukprot:gene3608-6342_t